MSAAPLHVISSGESNDAAVNRLKAKLPEVLGISSVSAVKQKLFDVRSDPPADSQHPMGRIYERRHRPFKRRTYPQGASWPLCIVAC